MLGVKKTITIENNSRVNNSETLIRGDLSALYRAHEGKISDKWSSYLSFYQDVFRQYRDRPVRILEIGIQNGGSLEIWERFFPNLKRIIGVDINPLCAELSYADPRISVVVGNANTDDAHAHILTLSDEFDIIIDDGSHQSCDIVRSFALYFPHLSPGGLYVAEDLHCSYMGRFQGGIEAPYSSIAFFKRLADLVNREHWGAPLRAEAILSYFASTWETRFDGDSLDMVDEVRFRNSVCIVSKGLSGTNLLGPRVIAGSVAFVEPVVAGIDGIHHVPTDETTNAYGPNTPRSENAVASRDSACLVLKEFSSNRQELQVKITELAIQAARTNEVEQQLQNKITELAIQATRTSEVEQQLQNKITELAIQATRTSEVEQHLQNKITELAIQAARTSEVEQQLIMARRRPHKLLVTLLAYRTLRVLSRIPLLPISTTARFTRSAAKRNPRQLLYNDKVSVPIKSARLVPVIAAQDLLLADATARFAGRDTIPGSVQGKTRFSILLPVYNTPPALLCRCLDTIIAQTYTGWELEVVNDASPSPEVKQVLDAYAARDGRIRVQELIKNRGIAGATQAALEMAMGSYICLMDHDDELTCDALERVAAVIAKKPDVGVIYSDECKLSPDGIPTEVFAKPDWSPSLLINCMYIGHLTTYRRELVVNAGGFRSEFDFSQDYDLALRITEGPVVVHHIPEILYGWRAIPESAAGGGKSFARESNIAALQSAADRRGWFARAMAEPYANVLKWHDDEKSPLLSLIIPSDNGTMIMEAVRSILDHSTYPRFEILIVTNSSLIIELNCKIWPASVHLIPFDRPFNFSEKSNVGAAAAKGEILVFYNDDVRVQTPDWMELLIDGFRFDNVGAVGPKLLYENDTIQHAGMVTGVRRFVGTAFHTLPASSNTYYNFVQMTREVSLLCGALMAVRRETFDLVGGFDAQHTPIYHSDVDLCFKIRERGHICLYYPQVSMLHIGHVSIGASEKKAKIIKQDKAGVYMLKRWAVEIATDPYFPVPMRDLCYHDSPEPFTIHPGSRVDGPVSGDVLLVSHDLSSSGAPRVVLEMARALQQEGWFVVVTAPTDGPMRAEFIALGITVVIDKLILSKHFSIRDFAKDYDLVIANTIVTWPIVAQLQGIVPLAWYIHEIDLVDHLISVDSDFLSTLGETETVWAGSELCAQNLRRFRTEVCVFEYGIEPFCAQARRELGSGKRLAVFASFEPRKGQDLLAEAYAALDPEEREGVSLHFYGRTLDFELFKHVSARFGHMPDLVFEGELEQSDYLIKLSASDMVIIPSRSDTLPLVSLDALGSAVPLMCTRETGTSAYLKDGVSGYVIPSATVEDITATLRRALGERDRWPVVGAAGAKVFNEHFSQETFKSKLAERAGLLSGKSNN